jgi:hypothetical protein
MDACHIFGTSINATDAEMTANQDLSNHFYNIIQHDQLLPQVSPAAEPFTSSTLLELSGEYGDSNQTQLRPFMSGSPFLHSFQQRGGPQSIFSAFFDPLSGTIGFNSEILTSGFLDRNLPEPQTSMDYLSPSFQSAFPPVDWHTFTSGNSIFIEPIATPDYTWPVAGSMLSQIPSIPHQSMITSATMASINPQHQHLHLGTIGDSYGFSDKNNTLGPAQSVPENMWQHKDGKTRFVEFIEISDNDDKSLPQHSSIGPYSGNMSGVEFGPSRPASLLPAAEEAERYTFRSEVKRRRESRKQGIYVRCRTLKVKVSQK